MKHAFEEHYGKRARWIARAPGRVNLIGEHTDYNGGFVLPMAIDRYTTIAAAPNSSNTITLHSTAFDEFPQFDTTKELKPERSGSWANYFKGVIAGFLEAGFRLPGFDALIDSNVPLGGGLSSSAALEVATATLLEAITGETLDPKHKARLCQKAEHTYAGVPCGIMDQLVSTLGRENYLLLIDCQSEDVDYIELADPEISVLIINTNVKHQLASSEYAQRRAQCQAAAKIMGVSQLRKATREQLQSFYDHEGIFPNAEHQMLYRRAHHVLSEDIRTLSVVGALGHHNWTAVGKLMYASHESLKNDYAVSCAELDAVVDIARGIGTEGGVYGCRMTGGGFGGCAVALIKTEAQDAITRTITTEYSQRTGITPTIFASRPARGAHVILSTEY